MKNLMMSTYSPWSDLSKNDGIMCSAGVQNIMPKHSDFRAFPDQEKTFSAIFIFVRPNGMCREIYCTRF